MKIIDGENSVLGRIAGYVAKEALKGERIVIVNCEKIIISGNKKNVKENFERKRRMGGSSQKGPLHSTLSERVVKRTIRGMLTNHRQGRGKIAYQKIKCYNGVPAEFEKSEKIKSLKRIQKKYVLVKEISK